MTNPGTEPAASAKASLPAVNNASLKVAIIQSDPVWENPGANRLDLDRRIDRLCQSGHPDVILLPEMFSTGFSMNAPDCAESMDGPTVQWMRQIARTRNLLLTGSLMILDSGNNRNRAICAFPDGSLIIYDKHHLFGPGGETGVYTPGDHKVEFTFRSFHIRLAVCYDLRFPEWLRSTPDSPWDLLLVMASWPQARQKVWETLLAARAIENQGFVAAANRTGTEPGAGGLSYQGGSVILDWNGNPLWSAGTGAGEGQVPLDRQGLQIARKAFPVLQDRDRPDAF